MLNNKTYPIIKIDTDYFMTTEYFDYSTKENEYEIYFVNGEPQLRLISQGDKSLKYAYKVLAATKKIGLLPLIEKDLFTIPATVGIEPHSVEVSHTFREDFSYPMKKINGYVKITKVNY